MIEMNCLIYHNILMNIHVNKFVVYLLTDFYYFSYRERYKLFRDSKLIPENM